MLKIFKNLRTRDWVMLGFGLIFIIAQVWLDLKIPEYMAQVTRLVKTPGQVVGAIWQQGGLMMLCALGSFVSAVIVVYLSARIGGSFSQRLRTLMFTKVNSFSTEEINRFSTASLITRSTNDITQVRMFITRGLQSIAKAPIMAIWAISKILGKGVEWSLITGGAVIILLIIVTLIMVFVLPKFKKMQTLMDNLTQVTRENLMGLPIIRAYNAEGYQEDKFDQANQELTKTKLFTSRGMAVMNPMMSFIMSGLSLAIYWSGAYMINAALPAERFVIFSNMVVFSSYAVQVVMSFMMLAMVFVMWPRASVSARRINEVIDTEPNIIFGNKEEGLPGLKGVVEFKEVRFRYPGAQECVLQDISFTVKQGQTIAFIGSTGSGKSTLINLVPRFFDVTSGQVLINGVDVKDYSEEALYSKIGYVPQRAVLFRGTIESNVSYGSDSINTDQVKQAVKIAQGQSFVESMTKQYQAEVAQGGDNLSGGQKQRVAIARAIHRQPEIYIFDDSFSALDYKTDQLLRQTLKKETAGVTSLIVAQRIGTIMEADQIIVMHDGRIVGQGTHRELLANCQIYQEIAASQLSEKELKL